jgi:cyclophilin family peptidyl-prolyl cis-trans isomerase
VLVALYAERAPKLTENFLKLCGEGFYDNTKVHRVRAGMLIEAGDPSTREDGGEDWGLGGADYTLEKTETGLSNFTGYLGMAVKQGEEDPNGSLFYLTVAPVHFFDHRYMVFGKVIEGLDVVSDISNAATEGPTGRPLNPIAILGTEVLPDA